MRRAPFPPLIAGAASLQAPPPDPVALRRRMADVYGVEEAQVLVVRGLLHGAEIVMRAVAAAEKMEIVCEPSAEMLRLAAIARVSIAASRSALTGALFASPDASSTAVNRAAEIAPALLVLDETMIEAGPLRSAAALTASCENLVVIRSLEYLYGLAGAPCGAIIASPGLIGRFNALLDPAAIATPVAKLAMEALDPTRLPRMRARATLLTNEMIRAAEALQSSSLVSAVVTAPGGVIVTALDTDLMAQQLRLLNIASEERADGLVFLPLGSADDNNLLLAAFGVAVPERAARRAEVVRESFETRIVASVDFDKSGQSAIDSGVGFFDHMLAQIATHAGISVTLNCAGDLEIDAHHTIEDCAIAFGQSLSKALGDRRGIARFGFLLPMDEAEAKVSVDLGGRPFLVFDGQFTAPFIGEYPTEMTAHVFRSLSQSLNAAIHVSVTGENDHHKTEACFKAFGRALRQAIAIESDEARSTKGFIL